MRSLTVSGFIVAFAAIGGCSSSSSSSTPPVDTCTGATVTVPTNQVATVPATSAPCVSLPADGSTYIVAPQMASGAGPSTQVGIEVGSGPPAAMDVLPEVASALPEARPAVFPRPRSIAAQFDHMLRENERTLPARARRVQAPQAAVVSAAVVPALGDTKIFWVRNSLSANTFTKDTGTVKYVGLNIVIYVSKRAPANGFSDAELTSIGNTFDQDLFPIDTVAFGSPSNQNGNNHVYVFMTPKVNALTTASDCATLGYIAGYFDGTDLVALPNSNGGEVFYAIVPDSLATISCTHTNANTGRVTLPTFIHEFQHMISFNQHFLVRGGSDEDTWLNEGLSHIAEELGSLYYEGKPPVAGDRTDPTQPFSDSAKYFLEGDLGNFDLYLQATAGTSVTLFASSGSLQERGAAWLFLRWLGDQKGKAVYRALDQTALTGIANIEAQSLETFPALFGDFSVALYTDSLPGMPRATAPPLDRYASRNLRFYANWLFTRDPFDFPRPFPIATRVLPLGAKSTTSMIVGTMTHWKITMPSTGSEMRLHFAASGGGTLPAGYNAQISVFHCPSAAACPQ